MFEFICASRSTSGGSLRLFWPKIYVCLYVRMVAGQADVPLGLGAGPCQLYEKDRICAGSIGQMGALNN